MTTEHRAAVANAQRITDSVTIGSAQPNRWTARVDCKINNTEYCGYGGTEAAAWRALVEVLVSVVDREWQEISSLHEAQYEQNFSDPD